MIDLSVYPDVLTVHVTQDHLERGKPGDPAECPIALAIRDAYPNLAKPQILYTTVVFQYNGRYRLSRRAAEAIRDIDYASDRLPRPATFRLRKMRPVEEV